MKESGIPTQLQLVKSGFLAALMGTLVIFVFAVSLRAYADRLWGLEPVQQVAKITLSARPESSGARARSLGRVALGQTDVRDAADVEHLLFQADDDGAFALRNVSQLRKLQLNYSSGAILSSDHILGEGDRILVGGRSFDVMLDGKQLSLIQDGAEVLSLPQVYNPDAVLTWGWQSYSARIGGSIGHDPALDDAVRGGPPLLRQTLGLVRLIINKRAAPPIVVAETNLPENALSILHDDGRYKLRAGSDDVFVEVCPKDGGCFELGRALWRVQDPGLGVLNGFIAGRTSYTVIAEPSALTLTQTTKSFWLRPEAAAQFVDAADVVFQPLLTPAYQAGLHPLAASEPLGTTELMRTAVGLAFAEMNSALILVLVAFFALELLRSGLQSGYLLLIAARSVAVWLFCVAALPGILTLPGTGVFAGSPLSLMVGILIGWTGLRLLLILIRRLYRRHPVPWNDLSFLIAQMVILGTTVGAKFAIFSGPAYTLKDGAATFAAVSALFCLLAVVGILMSFLPLAFNLLRLFALQEEQRCAMFSPVVAWVALMLICGISIASHAYLVFGQDISRFLVLYERHLAALAVLGLSAAWLLTEKPENFRRNIRSLIKLVDNDTWMSPGLVYLGMAAVVTLYFVMRLLNGAFPFDLAAPPPSTLIIGSVGALLAITPLFWLLLRSRLRLSLLRKYLLAKSNFLSIWILAPSVILGLLVFITPEQGIFGLQPTEAAKTWIAVLLAVLFARQIEGRIWLLPFEKGRPMWSLFFWTFLFAVVFMLGSFANNDMSPVAIFLLMLFGSLTLAALILALAASSWQVGALGVGLLVFGAVLYWSLESTAFWCTVLIGLLLLSIALTPRPRLKSLTPQLVRHPRGRQKGVPIATRLKRLLQNGESRLRVILAIVSSICIAATVVLVVNQFGAFSDQEKLENYDVEILGAQVPETPLERVLSYLDANLRSVDDDPVIRHPDLNLQVRESREIIANAGCGFWRGLAQASGQSTSLDRGLSLGAAWMADKVEPVVCSGDTRLFPQADLPVHPALANLPAVQDDFAANFVIGGLGRDAALTLLVAQVLLIAAMIAIAGRITIILCDRKSLYSVNLLGAVFLGNMALILMVQIILSWGNILGLLPVVGQPMTFVSLGASHHLFFGTPCALAAIAVSILNGQAALTAGIPVRQRFLGLRLARRTYA